MPPSGTVMQAFRLFFCIAEVGSQRELPTASHVRIHGWSGSMIERERSNGPAVRRDEMRTPGTTGSFNVVATTAMPDRYRCRLERAIVNEDRKDALEGLIRKLFERRHHAYVEGQEKEWLRIELVQSLREASQIYRDRLSSKTSGPLPFALGYFRLRDDRLELVSDRIPANVDPEPLARLLSEFLEPGAVLWCWEEGGERKGWEICGVGMITQRSSGGEADHAQEGADEESAGASS